MIKLNKTLVVFLMMTISTLLLAGCSLSTSKNARDIQKNQEETKRASDALETSQNTKQTASQTARYKIEFVAKWSLETHPDDYPLGAHFSPFVAYSHNDSAEAKIFNEGEIPTPGVEEMAETGAINMLVEEIQNLIDLNLAHTQTKGIRIDSPGIDSSELSLSQEYSHITFVSMLAPSPDWFVAESINLFVDGQWLEKSEIELETYDSGGDDGEDFTSKDLDSNPKKSITIFSENLQNLGKLVLTKNEQLP